MAQLINWLFKKIRRSCRGIVTIIIVYTLASYIRNLRLRRKINSDTFGSLITEKSTSKDYGYLYQFYPAKDTNPCKNSTRFGLSYLYEPNIAPGLSTESRAPSINPSVDIILVHGLSGSHLWSWLDSSQDVTKTKTFWPRDWLPRDLKERVQQENLGVRVLALRYDQLIGSDPESIVLTLLQSLVCAGVLESSFLTFLAVDFGGNLVKRLLTLNTTTSRRLAEKTAGVMFFGTPHSEEQGRNSYETMLGGILRGRSPFDDQNHQENTKHRPRKLTKKQEEILPSYGQFVRAINATFFQDPNLRHVLYSALSVDDPTWSPASFPVSSPSLSETDPRSLDTDRNVDNMTYNYNNTNSMSDNVMVLIPFEVGLKHPQLCHFSDKTSLRYLSVVSFLETAILRSYFGRENRTNDQVWGRMIASAPEIEE